MKRGAMSAVQLSGGLSKLKKKHFRVKHQKVKLFRANEPLLSVLMWGVNHTINELSHVNIPVMLLPDDFRAYSKLKVDNHLFNKENMPSHFKVKEYCPLVFRNLRERFGIDDQDYKESMTSVSAIDVASSTQQSLRNPGSAFRKCMGGGDCGCSKAVQGEGATVLARKRPCRECTTLHEESRSQPVLVDSPGKSGAKFYQSWDKLFIVKTLTSEEVERMHSFLKHYHPYIVERHGKTLLPQYLGMYRLTVDGVEHYVVVMRNVFSNHLRTHRKFDLKGSTVDREASDKEKEKDLPTLKDNDFVKEGLKVYIGDEAKEKLLETLTADVGFLTKLHLMDYSLLLGLHDVERAEEERHQAAAAAAAAAAAGSSDGEDVDGAGGDGGGGIGTLDEDDEDSSGSGVVRGPMGLHGGGYIGMTTPPDSPRTLVREAGLHDGCIIPELDIYAVPSAENAPRKEIYFLALIDVLTHYGVKKQAAKAAKTVKYGANVDGISTCDPEQYGKRFIEFMSKAIE
ncbi:phosphatidylinositol 5-phosphate 4-kinase type-2 alpha isoform X1 [Ischnura elegans]|uniref:phosphatidylinositol 5-phosphate 4-kinase type-2 alpha isoform X1 n=1 Tax=Ischnura elegans TaxID=197161 RepID=UPI001ED86BD5|nr:phosphatidylinositol 5-phosphate 4-kinase type-2 alpha isoform X1 [Ischnura elegans]